MDERARQYLTHGQHTVAGWLNQSAALVIAELANTQVAHGVTGPVCEIGIHHGRLFILLHLLTRPAERSVAIDLFELQEENVSQSGEGSRDRFLANLRAHGCDLNRIVIVTENSLRVTPAQILDSCGGQPRIFSVDGGHTAHITQNDLALAHSTVCEGGIVILDDYFNEAWPAVSVGTCEFMRQHADLVPVAIGGNKFIFAKTETLAETYRDAIRELPGLAVRRTEVFDREVAVFEPLTWKQKAVQTRLWRTVRSTPLGAFLRLVGQRL